MFTRILVDGINLSFRSSFSVLAFEIEGIVVSSYSDTLVWTLSLDGEVLCAMAYTSIKRPGVPVSWESRFGQLISLLCVSFSLGMFDTVSCLLMLCCVPGVSFSLLVIDFVLLQRRICDTSF